MITNPPQNGHVTHHQLQLITPHSFNVINTIPSNPNNPIPLFEPDSDFPIVLRF